MIHAYLDSLHLPCMMRHCSPKNVKIFIWLRKKVWRGGKKTSLWKWKRYDSPGMIAPLDGFCRIQMGRRVAWKPHSDAKLRGGWKRLLLLELLWRRPLFPTITSVPTDYFFCYTYQRSYKRSRETYWAEWTFFGKQLCGTGTASKFQISPIEMAWYMYDSFVITDNRLLASAFCLFKRFRYFGSWQVQISGWRPISKTAVPNQEQFSNNVVDDGGLPGSTDRKSL